MKGERWDLRLSREATSRPWRTWHTLNFPGVLELGVFLEITDLILHMVKRKPAKGYHLILEFEYYSDFTCFTNQNYLKYKEDINNNIKNWNSRKHFLRLKKTLKSLKADMKGSTPNWINRPRMTRRIYYNKIIVL